MNITLQDRSQYHRGLLILIRKDKEITDPERHLVQRIGHTLGFNRAFTQTSIDSVLANSHISEAGGGPCFFFDGLGQEVPPRLPPDFLFRNDNPFHRKGLDGTGRPSPSDRT